jgi:uncharacterized UPF0160 family protein
MKPNNLPNIKTIGTHDEVFHADDVFAIATLIKLFPDAKVIRTRDAEVLNNCDLVVDVGGVYDYQKNRYDHHQQEFSETHDNGIVRSGFGLIWLHFGIFLSGSKYVQEKIDNSLVATIDALDNGQALYEYTGFETPAHTITDFIENRNPFGGAANKSDYDEAFFDAVPLASEYLTILIEKYRNKEQDGKLFLSQYKKSTNQKIAILDKRLDSGDVEIEQPELIYVIFPRIDGSWNVKAVAVDSNHQFENRLPFPVSWRGKKDIELKQACGIEGAKFCHRSGFLAVVESKEDAILLAEKSLKQAIV